MTEIDTKPEMITYGVLPPSDTGNDTYVAVANDAVRVFDSPFLAYIWLSSMIIKDDTKAEIK